MTRIEESGSMSHILKRHVTLPSTHLATRYYQKRAWGRMTFAEMSPCWQHGNGSPPPQFQTEDQEESLTCVPPRPPASHTKQFVNVDLRNFPFVGLWHQQWTLERSIFLWQHGKEVCVRMSPPECSTIPQDCMTLNVTLLNILPQRQLRWAVGSKYKSKCYIITVASNN